MRAVVVYESMFGNTRQLAERIGEGLRTRFDVTVMPVTEAIGTFPDTFDLVVVGGPTHVHGMSKATTRKAAAQQADADEELDLEPSAEGPGLRDWFGGLAKIDRVPAAAFDTRIDASPLLTGRASKGIAKQLTRHGFRLVADPESFLVDKENHLLVGESVRAVDWGAGLATTFAPAS